MRGFRSGGRGRRPEDVAHQSPVRDDVLAVHDEGDDVEGLERPVVARPGRDRVTGDHVAVPETTGYTAVSPGAAMSMPLWNWKIRGPLRPSVSMVFQKRVRGSPK